MKAAEMKRNPENTRVLEIAKALAVDREGDFDLPLGASENCLSARALVRLIKGGAEGVELEHLLECPPCLENLERLDPDLLEPSPSFVADALSQVANEETPTRAASPAKHALAAVLGLQDKVLHVAKPLAKTHLALRCTVIPVFDKRLLKLIAPESLRLEGAIKATSGEIVERDLDHDGTPDVIEITFRHGSLSSRAKRAISHGQGIIDSVMLHGRIESDDPLDLFGQARIELLEEELA